MSIIPQNSMVNQPQGHNSMDSSAALLQQQQHNFDVQVSYLIFYFRQKENRFEICVDQIAPNGPATSHWSN